MTLLLWISATLVIYVYVGFPLLVLARAALRPRHVRAGPASPMITVVVAAYNEAAVIGAKLDSVLAQRYPPSKLGVVVASDGSTDGTEAVVAAYADPRIRLLALPRSGKAAALAAALAETSSEIVVLSDANSILAPDALAALTAPFADPDVGAVAGDQRYLPPDHGLGREEQRYWSLDRLLKKAMSRAGSATCATGALYAIRRELIDQVPEGVTDDFFISTGAIVHHRRLVFAGDALAYESVAPSAAREFERKARIVARGLRAVAHRRELLSVRRHGFYAVQLLSHKVLRRLVAVPLIGVAVASGALATSSRLLLLVAGLQALFYVSAGTGLLLARHGRATPRLLGLPAYFCLVNVAALVAVWRLLRGRAPVRWEPQREEAPVLVGPVTGRQRR